MGVRGGGAEQNTCFMWAAGSQEEGGRNFSQIYKADGSSPLTWRRVSEEAEGGQVCYTNGASLGIKDSKAGKEQLLWPRHQQS